MSGKQGDTSSFRLYNPDHSNESARGQATTAMVEKVTLAERRPAQPSRPNGEEHTPFIPATTSRSGPFSANTQGQTLGAPPSQRSRFGGNSSTPPTSKPFSFARGQLSGLPSSQQPSISTPPMQRQNAIASTPPPYVLGNGIAGGATSTQCAPAPGVPGGSGIDGLFKSSTRPASPVLGFNRAALVGVGASSPSPGPVLFGASSVSLGPGRFGESAQTASTRPASPGRFRSSARPVPSKQGTGLFGRARAQPASPRQGTGPFGTPNQPSSTLFSDPIQSECYESAFRFRDGRSMRPDLCTCEARCRPSSLEEISEAFRAFNRFADQCRHIPELSRQIRDWSDFMARILLEKASSSREPIVSH